MAAPNSRPKAKVILFCNQKGGCGKSSNIVNMSSASLFSGNTDVVVLDCDPQRTMHYWQTADRTQQVSNFDYVLPQVECVPPGVMPSEMIQVLLTEVSEIWVDTAGFVGYQKETAQRYIEDILPWADIVVTPLKGSKFDIRSTEQTIDYLDSLLKNMDRDIPRVLLRSDVKGGEKGIKYFDTLMEPLLNKYPHWKCLSTYIPSSILFTRALERGGNAFVPRRIKHISDASLEAYSEIQVALGVKSVKQARKALSGVIDNLAQIRSLALREKVEADKQALPDDTMVYEG